MGLDTHQARMEEHPEDTPTIKSTRQRVVVVSGLAEKREKSGFNQNRDFMHIAIVEFAIVETYIEFLNF